MKFTKYILIISLLIVLIGLALFFGRKKISFPPKKMVRAKVAIVIDDWGYNLHTLNLLAQIKPPVTVSILPNLNFSAKVAQIAKEQGKEVILHLPLEPQIQTNEKITLEKNTITTQMSKDEVVTNMVAAFSSVPYALGVSNHMGSGATQDVQLMSIIFEQLKKRKLFFLDNLVTDQSICKKVAQKMKVKYISRDFFLDNSDNDEYIRRQIEKLIEFALVSKEAVGVGHARPATLKILKEEMPLLEAKGIKFVFVSDLVK